MTATSQSKSELHHSNDETIAHARGELSFEWVAVRRANGVVTHYESVDGVFYDDSWYGGKHNGVSVVIHTHGSKWVIVVICNWLRGKPCRAAQEGRIRMFGSALAAAKAAEESMIDRMSSALSRVKKA